MMILRNLTRQTILAERPVRACSFADRCRGMIGRDFALFDAMIFERCSAIHTFFMSIPIDVIFTDRENRIVRTASFLSPWIPYCSGGRSACTALEFPAGTLERSGTLSGDFIDLDADRVEKLEFYKKKSIFLTEQNN